jgi:hypothetical protein
LPKHSIHCGLPRGHLQLHDEITIKLGQSKASAAFFVEGIRSQSGGSTTFFPLRQLQPIQSIDCVLPV